MRHSRLGDMQQRFLDELLNLRSFKFQVSESESGSACVILEPMRKRFDQCIVTYGHRRQFPAYPSFKKIHSLGSHLVDPFSFPRCFFP
jgi:hypothetical protein